MGIITICAIAFIVIGMVFLAISLLQMRKAKTAESWPTIAGTVLSSELEEHRSHNSKTHTTTVTYTPKVEYQYELLGTKYLGKKISFGSAAYDYNTASGKLAPYPNGAAVTVHYDPSEPSKAVLEPKAAGSTPMIVLAAIFILVGIVVLIVT